MKDFSRLSLEEKAGQIFFLGFRGYEPDSETRALLQSIRPGGIILSQRNIESFDQISGLTGLLARGREIPPLLGMSQEGGGVDKLRHLFGPMPALSDIAQEGITRIRLAARILATELESIGINTNFAPVLDLGAAGSFLKERTFASTAHAVTRLATAFVEEFEGRGVFLCPKHFPGLGSASRDPHFVLPRIDKTRKSLMQEDAVPFIQLASKVPMMMVGHGFYPALTDDRPTPACLSSRIVDGLLRRKLGFQGVIVTDDMTMGAVTGMGLTPDLFLEAFEAGNDMLLFSETTPLAEKGFRLLVKNAKSSSILRARLDESVLRILSLKHAMHPPAGNRVLMRARVIRQVDRLQRVTEARASRSPVAS